MLPSLYMENLLNLHNPLFHDSFKYKNSLVIRYTAVCKFVYGDFYYLLVHSNNINSIIEDRRYILIQCNSKYDYQEHYYLHEDFFKKFNFKAEVKKTNISLLNSIEKESVFTDLVLIDIIHLLTLFINKKLIPNATL